MAIQAQFPSYGAAADWVDIGRGSGGYDNSFGLQQHKEHLLLLQQQQLLQNPQQLSSSSTLKCNYPNVVNPPPQSMLAAYEDTQRREIDQYLKIQNERLRILLLEQRRQQLSMVYKAVEARAGPLLRQRDDDMARASAKTRELEEFLNKLEAENREWQRLAQENESMAVSLNETIERLREKATGCSSGEDDAESCCVGNSNNRVEDQGETMTKKMVCRSCNCRESRVVFLPCRHLSACEACEKTLGACPVCLTPKKATIQALMG